MLNWQTNFLILFIIHKKTDIRDIMFDEKLILEVTKKNHGLELTGEILW